jgi:hypothetical protein
MKAPLRIEFLCDNALEVVDANGCSIFELMVEDYSIPRETVADLQEILNVYNKAKKENKTEQK